MLTGIWANAEKSDSIGEKMIVKELPGVEVKAKARVELTPLDVTTISSEQIDRSTESSLLPVVTMDIPGFFTSERGFVGYGVSSPQS